jgi:DNA modification methylase
MIVKTKLLIGDALSQLIKLPSDSVHCCVTSPPYYGLRDYGTATWEGGNPECDHRQGRPGAGRADGIVDERSQRNRDGVGAMGGDCKCGARRIDAQMGLEASPDEYVAAMVGVFREVRRVLRSDGTLWLNIGDSYHNYRVHKDGGTTPQGFHNERHGQPESGGRNRGTRLAGIKEKDLIGIPWMLAFALRADGWWLRQDIIWAKPNPMPESVTDRCTKAHEYLFLLSKSERYYFDAAAIAEGAISNGQPRRDNGDGDRFIDLGMYSGRAGNNADGSRNKRSVWTVATAPYRKAHFATFPPKLIEPCIMASTSEKGVCAVCGAPWVRQTTNWNQVCNCPLSDPIPATVLDPFFGAGTTGVVAQRLWRSCIGIDLSSKYADMSKERMPDGLLYSLEIPDAL